MARVPEVYRRVLELVDEQLPDEEIARLLGVDPSAVPALIDLATAKYERAASEPPAHDEG